MSKKPKSTKLLSFFVPLLSMFFFLPQNFSLLLVFITYLLWCINLFFNFGEFVSLLFAFYNTFAAYLLNANTSISIARDFFRSLFSHFMCAVNCGIPVHNRLQINTYNHIIPNKININIERSTTVQFKL